MGTQPSSLQVSGWTPDVRTARTSEGMSRVAVRGSGGFSLLELLMAMAVLGICLAVATVILANGLSRQEARAAAQDWQSAAAWAQVGVLWQGGHAAAGYGSDGVAIAHGYELCGGDLGSAAPIVPVSANYRRWINDKGAVVTFVGLRATPDGGGSLYFHASKNAYRVVVRPESGLTVRSWAED
jgi:prepilin-type N-terminal cleavage/methylation domain-containing protein